MTLPPSFSFPHTSCPDLPHQWTLSLYRRQIMSFSVCRLSTEKKMHNLRVMFYSADIWRTLSLGHSISDNAEKLFRRGKWGARIYRDFCNKRPGSWTIKGLLLIKENEITQIKEFSAFLCMGRCMSLGSLKSFLFLKNILDLIFTLYWSIADLQCYVTFRYTM